MSRRTKEQIQSDNEFTCSKRGCKKLCEEVYIFTHYHHKASDKNLEDQAFCEDCFKEYEEQFKPKLRIVND